MEQKKLNAVYSSRKMKRRYEVWFLRCGLADGSGGWWLRYLVMNLGRRSWRAAPTAQPAQVWATWFPRNGEPRSFIQGFPIETLQLSEKGALPFYCWIADKWKTEFARAICVWRATKFPGSWAGSPILA